MNFNKLVTEQILMDLKLLEYRKRREYLILDGGGEQIMIFKLKLITNKKTHLVLPWWCSG